MIQDRRSTRSGTEIEIHHRSWFRRALAEGGRDIAMQPERLNSALALLEQGLRLEQVAKAESPKDRPEQPEAAVKSHELPPVPDLAGAVVVRKIG